MRKFLLLSFRDLFQLQQAKFTLIAFILLSYFTTAKAQSLVGQIRDSGGGTMTTPQSVYVSGNYAYVAAAVSNTLEIVDITNPALPVHKGSIAHGAGGALLNQPWSVFVLGNYAYVASRNSSALEIVDVTNPAAPVHKGSITNGTGGALLSYPQSVYVSGNYAYVTSYSSNALEIVDVTNPAAPVHKGSIAGSVLTNPTSVFVSGNYAFITTTQVCGWGCSGSNALEIVDVTTPAAPVHKGSILDGAGGALLNSPQSVFVSGNYAYVASSGNNALEIVDVTTPATPLHKGSITNSTGGALLYNPRSVFVSGNYAYVASYNSNALEIVDVTTPATPLHKGSITNGTAGALLSTPNSVFVSGNYAYVTSYSSSGALEIVDVTTPSAPLHKSSLVDGNTGAGALLNGAHNVFVSGNYAYVVGLSSNALEILDVSNPAAPLHKGSITNGTGGALLSYPQSVYVAGNYAYVTSYGSNALEIIDVTNPAIPVHKGSIVNGTGGALLGQPNSVYVSGNYAYVTSYGSNALEIIDVTNPATPVHQGSISNGNGGALLGNPQSVFVSGNYAYVASYGSNALEIIDVTNTATPVHKGSISDGGGGITPLLSGPSSVFVYGNYAFVASRNNNALEIVDVTNPAAPVHMGSITNTGGASISAPNSVYVAGNRAYVASPATLEVVDITNPAAPVHVSSFGGGASLSSVFVSGNYFYLTDQSANALDILRFAPSVTSFSPASGTVGTTVTITGTNFDPVPVNNIVNFNNVLATVTASTPTTITTSVPAGAKNGPITVTVAGLKATATPNFQVIPVIAITSASTGAYGGTINLTTNTGGATGAVTYSVTNGTGSASVSGSTLSLNGIGTVTVTANIAADANYAAATSAPQTITITKATPTVLITSASTGIYNGTIYLTANTGGSPGALTYSVVNVTGSATLLGNVLSLTGVGTVTVTASVGATANYNAATSAPQTITIYKATPVIAMTSASTGVYNGTINLTANTGGSTGTLTYSVVNLTGSATVSGSTLTLSGAGTVQVIANVSATANYNAATSTPQTVTISKANQTITFNTSFSALCIGNSLTLNSPVVYANSGLPLTFSMPSSSIASLNVNVLSGFSAGSVIITASQAGNSNYNPASTSFTISINICSGPSLTGQIRDAGTMNSPQSVFVSGNYAYVVSSISNALEIVDVTNPAAPVHKGSITNGTGGASLSSPKSVYVLGNYAYVAAAGSNTLEIVDITNPALPVHKGSITNGAGGALLNQPWSVFVLGNYAYVASRSSHALEIVDVTNPAAPVHKGSITNGTGGALLSYPQSVYVSGNYAYVASYSSSALEIVDVTNPAAPVHKGSIANGAGAVLSNPTSVFVSGNYAFITTTQVCGWGCSGSNALEIVDVTTPAAPVHKGSILDGAGGALLNNPQSVFVSGNYAYVASSGNNALEIVDVTTPATPLHKGSITNGTGGALLTSPNSVFVSGNYAYVTSYSSTGALEIVDVTTPSAPLHKSNLVNGNTVTGALLIGARNVFVSGNYAYVASYSSNALEIVDVANPASPLHKGSIINGAGGALLSNPQSVFVSGNYAYVASYGSNALEIIDVTNPAAPVHKGSITNGTGGALLSYPQSVYVSGNYAYVTSYGNALEIVDVTNPAAPLHKGSITNGTGGALLGNPQSVFVSGNYAYVASYGNNALEIIDVTNPATPVHKGSISDGGGIAPLLSGPSSVFVSGNYAFVASRNSSALEIVDVTNPAAPVHMGSINNSGSASISTPNSVYVVGNRAYVASPNALEVVNITNLAAPVHNSSFVSSGYNFSSLFVSGNYAYLTDQSANALDIFKLGSSVTSFSPASGTVGTTVTITGTNFDPVPANNIVNFNNVHATVTASTTTSITTSVPVGAKNGPLTVTVGGLTATATPNFQVIPAVSITSPNSGLYGGTINLTTNTGGSTGAITYTVVNGSPGSASLSGSTLTLTGAGTVTVTATVAGDANYAAATSAPQIITINKVTPTISITSPNSGTYGGTINLTTNTGGSTGTVTYSVTNGTGSATVSGNVLNLLGAGTVTLAATLAADANYNPATSLPQTITINKANQTITFPGLANMCPGTSTSLNATSSSGLPITYSSSNTSIATISGNTLNAIAAGSVTITASQGGNTNYNAATNVSQPLTVNPIPSLSSTLSPPFVCAGSTFNYTPTSAVSGATFSWSRAAVSGILPASASSGTGNVSEGLNNYTSSPINVVYVYTTSANGCSNSASPQSVVVTVNPKPTLTASSGPTTICYGGSTSITLGGYNIVRYSWTPSTGVSFGNFNVNQATLNPTTSTEYAFTGIDANGCTSDPIIDYITVNPLPSVTVSPSSSTICSGTSTTLTASGATSYSWSTGATTASISVSPTTATTYTVTGTTNGCSASQSSTISIKSPKILISASNGYDLCVTSSTTLTATAISGATSYTWSTDETGQSITVYGPGTYTVAADIPGCGIKYASATTTYNCSPPPPPDPCLQQMSVPQSGFTSQMVAPCSGSPAAIQVENNKPFSYYPNPASGEITIVLTKIATEDAPVLWYDMSGHQVRTDVIEKGKKEKTFRLDEIINGMYLVQVKDNDRVRYSKIVVAK